MSFAKTTNSLLLVNSEHTQTTARIKFRDFKFKVRDQVRKEKYLIFLPVTYNFMHFFVSLSSYR